jgi:hypothetical protein
VDLDVGGLGEEEGGICIWKREARACVCGMYVCFFFFFGLVFFFFFFFFWYRVLYHENEMTGLAGMDGWGCGWGCGGKGGNAKNIRYVYDDDDDGRTVVVSGDGDGDTAACL